MVPVSSGRASRVLNYWATSPVISFFFFSLKKKSSLLPWCSSLPIDYLACSWSCMSQHTNTDVHVHRNTHRGREGGGGDVYAFRECGTEEQTWSLSHTATSSPNWTTSPVLISNLYIHLCISRLWPSVYILFEFTGLQSLQPNTRNIEDEIYFLLALNYDLCVWGIRGPMKGTNLFVGCVVEIALILLGQADGTAKHLYQFNIGQSFFLSSFLSLLLNLFFMVWEFQMSVYGIVKSTPYSPHSFILKSHR